MDHPNPVPSPSEMARLAVEQQRLAQNDADMPWDSYGDDYDLELGGENDISDDEADLRERQLMELKI